MSYTMVSYKLAQYYNYLKDGKYVSVSSLSPSVASQFGTDPLPSFVYGSRKKPAKDELLWNPTAYSKARVVVRHPVVRIWQKSDAGYTIDQRRYEWEGRRTSYFFDAASIPTFTLLPPDPMNAALNKLRDEVTNFGTMLGEFRETSNMFHDVAKKLLKSHRLLRKGRVTDAVKALGTIPPRTKHGGRTSLSGSYLQYHFGVETLLEDLHTAVKDLDGAIEKKDGYVRVSKSYKRTAALGGYGFNGNGDLCCAYTESVTRRVTIDAIIDSSAIKRASDYGLTSIPSLIWELTSLSWAFDYVIKVGEWLQALDVPMFLTKASAFETRRSVQIGYVGGRGNWGLASQFRVIDTTRRAPFTQRRTERIIRTVAAVRPQFNPKLTLTRTANLLSVLRQRTR